MNNKRKKKKKYISRNRVVGMGLQKIEDPFLVLQSKNTGTFASKTVERCQMCLGV
jgi:hypothetical protein